MSKLNHNHNNEKPLCPPNEEAKRPPPQSPKGRTFYIVETIVASAASEIPKRENKGYIYLAVASESECMVSDVFVNCGANTEVDTCGLEDEIKPSDIYTRTWQMAQRHKHE